MYTISTNAIAIHSGGSIEWKICLIFARQPTYYSKPSIKVTEQYVYKSANILDDHCAMALNNMAGRYSYCYPKIFHVLFLHKD